MDLKFFFAPIICYQLIPSLLFTCISNSFLFILYPWWGWDVILKSIFVTPQFAWLFNIGCLYLFCYPASACAPFWLFLSFSHISGLSSALYPSHRDLTSDGVNAANADLAILCLFLHYVTLCSFTWEVQICFWALRYLTCNTRSIFGVCHGVPNQTVQ